MISVESFSYTFITHEKGVICHIGNYSFLQLVFNISIDNLAFMFYKNA